MWRMCAGHKHGHQWNCLMRAAAFYNAYHNDLILVIGAAGLQSAEQLMGNVEFQQTKSLMMP